MSRGGNLPLVRTPKILPSGQAVVTPLVFDDHSFVSAGEEYHGAGILGRGWDRAGHPGVDLHTAN